MAMEYNWYLCKVKHSGAFGLAKGHYCHVRRDETGNLLVFIGDVREGHRALETTEEEARKNLSWVMRFTNHPSDIVEELYQNAKKENQAQRIEEETNGKTAGEEASYKGTVNKGERAIKATRSGPSS